MKDRYSIFVGLLFLAIVVLAFVYGAPGGDRGTLGLDKMPPRWPLPEFAVPVAASRLEGDANIAQDDCETSQVPCPVEARRTPACHVAGADVIRVCDLFEKPSVISFWFSKGGECVDQQDILERAYERYRGRVNFLSIDVHDDRDEVRALVRERGWKMPVGYDHDGAVAALYRVGGCPTLAYAFPGGTLQSAGIELTSAALDAHIRRLLRATDAAEGA
ncbi:MAG TPA: TlpA disulfide reductase family protein [Solirubrobacterales bacterium]|nr:TlpA disulfide reductase family protein [Solirubrobacterales bacterium]